MVQRRTEKTEDSEFDGLGYLIVHERLGIWLGGQGSVHFWSKVGSHPFYAAPTFRSPEECHEQIYRWSSNMDLLDGPDAFVAQEITREDMDALRVARVQPDLFESGARFASMEACMVAGLPGWLHYGEEPADGSVLRPTCH